MQLDRSNLENESQGKVLNELLLNLTCAPASICHLLAVPGNVLLWLAQNDGDVATTGLLGQWQAGAATDAANGIADHYYAQTPSDKYTRASNLSVPAARCGH